MKPSTQKQAFYSLLGISLLLGLWHIGHLSYGSLVLPGLGETCEVFIRLLQQGKMLPALAATASHAATGWLFAVVVGVIAGALAGIKEEIYFTLRPIAVILLGIPAIAWVVLTLLWFGGHKAVMFTVMVATAPLIFAAATQGVRSLDNELSKMARVFRAPPVSIATDVYGPHMLSHLFPAFVTTLAMSWKVSVMAELFSGSGGIGDGIAAARARVDTAETMAWITLVVMVLVVVDMMILRPLQSRFEAWRSDNGSDKR